MYCPDYHSNLPLFTSQAPVLNGRWLIIHSKKYGISYLPYVLKSCTSPPNSLNGWDIHRLEMAFDEHLSKLEAGNVLVICPAWRIGDLSINKLAWRPDKTLLQTHQVLERLSWCARRGNEWQTIRILLESGGAASKAEPVHLLLCYSRSKFGAWSSSPKLSQ